MATYNTALGVLPSPKTQLFGGNAGQGEEGGGSGGMAQPVQKPPVFSTGGQQQRTPTFAELQKQGQPRPAPQPFSLGQTYQQGPQSQALLQQLTNRLDTMQNAPSVYEDPAFAQRRQAAMANLQAERQASESALGEEMARRGLSASSIAAGRMGDIAGQFARAQGTLEADLLKEAMGQEQQRQQFLTQQLGQIFGTLGEQELGGFRASVESARAQADINARAAELQQNERLRGRELDLTAARDQATREYQSGQLGLGYAEMGSRERLAANELAARRELQQSEGCVGVGGE